MEPRVPLEIEQITVRRAMAKQVADRYAGDRGEMRQALTRFSASSQTALAKSPRRPAMPLDAPYR